jgi:hypothetical protein
MLRKVCSFLQCQLIVLLAIIHQTATLKIMCVFEQFLLGCCYGPSVYDIPSNALAKLRMELRVCNSWLLNSCVSLCAAHIPNAVVQVQMLFMQIGS